MVITASVISTNEADKLGPCLESLGRQQLDAGWGLKVVVLCNGGERGEQEIVDRFLPDAQVIIQEERKGFSENHNLAQREGVGYRIILNPDVVLDENAVMELVKIMERHSRCGIAGPLMVYPNGDAQPSARKFPKLAGTLIRRTPLRAVFPPARYSAEHYLPAPDQERMVDWLLGACICVRPEAWDELGGLDGGFSPLYVEDIDVCWRAWEAGWEVWQAPSARVVHEHQAATDKNFFDRRTLWHARGMLRFLRKHPQILWSNVRLR